MIQQLLAYNGSDKTFQFNGRGEMRISNFLATIRNLSGTSKTKICQVYKGVVKGQGSTSPLGEEFNTSNRQEKGESTKLSPFSDHDRKGHLSSMRSRYSVSRLQITCPFRYT